ncbi:MAG: flippase [Anaerolineae bacterium]|nr:flippase [Anaerolineae bacterium]
MRQLARDTAFNVTRQTWSILIGLVISILLARGLGTENRGAYAVVIVFAAIGVTFLNGGIGVALTYYLAKQELSLLTAVHLSLFLSTVTSLIGLAVGGALIALFHEAVFPGIAVHLLLIGLVIIPTTLFRDNLQVIFLGLQDFRAYNLIGLIPYTLILIFTLALVWGLRLGVEGALLANVIGHGASLLATFLLVRRRLPSGERIFPVKFTLAQARQMITFGLLVHLSNVIVYFNYRADIFLLNLLTSRVSVGLYDVAVTLGERIWLLSSAVSTVIFPRIASLQTDQERQQVTPIVTRYVFWFVLIVAAIVYGIAEWGVIFIYGAEFQGAAVVLRLLLPGIILESISKILANDIAGRGRPQLNALLATTASAINIAANLILIPRIDLLGSALATSISYSVLALSIMFIFCRMTGIPARDLILPSRADLILWRRGWKWLRSRLHSAE